MEAAAAGAWAVSSRRRLAGPARQRCGDGGILPVSACAAPRQHAALRCVRAARGRLAYFGRWQRRLVCVDEPAPVTSTDSSTLGDASGPAPGGPAGSRRPQPRTDVTRRPSAVAGGPADRHAIPHRLCSSGRGCSLLIAREREQASGKNGDERRATPLHVSAPCCRGAVGGAFSRGALRKCGTHCLSGPSNPATPVGHMARTAWILSLLFFCLSRRAASLVNL